MPAIGTIHAQKRNRAIDSQPVRRGIPLAIHATETALSRLSRATEKPTEILEAIEVLAGLLDTLRSLESQPVQTVNAYGPSLSLDFRKAHGLLRNAGLESGGLHDCLHSAERAMKQAQDSQQERVA